MPTENIIWMAKDENHGSIAEQRLYCVQKTDDNCRATDYLESIRLTHPNSYKDLMRMKKKNRGRKGAKKTL